MAEHVTIAKASDTFVDPQGGRKTIDSIYKEWLAVRTPFWKPSYRSSIETAWSTHVEPQWANRRIGDITNAELQAWVSELSSRRSASVVLRAVGIMDGMLGKACRDRLLQRNPCDGLELPRKPKRKERRIYLSIPQLIGFANECGNAMRIGEERRALVLLLGFCGLRWGEAAALRKEDVNIEERKLTIRHNIVAVKGKPVEGTPKSYEMRTLYMPAIVTDALAPVLAHRKRGERVFSDPSGKPIREQSASAVKGNRTWWPSALKRLGWDSDDWPSPHDLRHTAASIAVHAGANVKGLQRMLGHSSAAMTLDVYADLFDSDLLDVTRMVDAAVQLESGAERECGQNVGKNVPEPTVMV
ncbi:tyrosine-type recombinase/integrase [Bifidobacterium imperatoris]